MRVEIGKYPPRVILLWVKYYSREAGAYVKLSMTSPDWRTFCQAVCEYYFYRFTDGRTQFTRTYDSLKGTLTYTSQRYMQTSVGTQINDGVSTRNYYASEVRKDAQNDKISIVWVED